MNRRPFLHKLGLLGTSLMTMPFISYGKMEFPKATRLKFITASDGHWGQPNTDFETSHRNLIEAIHREKDVDFVVFNGDLIHDEPKFLPQVMNVYEQLQMPWYATRGNHDRVSEAVFQEVMHQPTNFSFIAKDSGILLLDCSNEKGEYLCADLEFTKTILDEYAKLPQVFVFVHISQNDWTRHGVDCKPFLDLVTSYPNVKATFHGHDHDVDGQMIYKKKPFLWSGHFGGSWGNPFPSYRVCEVGEDGKAITYLKTVKEGMILNGHNL
ncbi:metallophosphoesterase [Algoriphagus sp. AK58]|uniref:metallophosphoesterase family protein n=1 Tax=Algoriphagus sp. AK58 TaxID=1406877 RepID=UPI0021045E35|nr:metallophosphoesterase [Algoriphagus sp. AK58]